MTLSRNRNIFGALALMVSDDIQQAAAAHSPEAGPTAAALALLAHEPGLSIRTLAAGVGLSHAGTVRLVDRLERDALIERREHAHDGRTRSLYLTPIGEQLSRQILQARDDIIQNSLAALDDKEVALLATLAEKVLKSRLKDSDHAYRICRLCDNSRCDACPVTAALAPCATKGDDRV